MTGSASRVQGGAATVPVPRATAPAPAAPLRFADLLRQRRPSDGTADAPAPRGPLSHEAEVDVEAEARALADDPLPGALHAPAGRGGTRAGDDVAEADGGVLADDPPPAPGPVDAPWALGPDGVPAALRELGATVAGFCNDCGPGDGGLWQVQMALRPDVAPDTILHLTLSPHWLTLRFEVGSAGVRDLLSTGHEALVQVLEHTLTRQRDIAITFDPP